MSSAITLSDPLDWAIDNRLIIDAIEEGDVSVSRGPLILKQPDGMMVRRFDGRVVCDRHSVLKS